jgi:nitrite reductase/ring-hydroxylating ferredoxin subunit
MKNEHEMDPCAACALSASSRRSFVRSATMAVGALVSIGVRPLLAGPSISYPVPAADGATIDRKNEVVLTRWQGAVYAFALSCPHQKTALRWITADTRFQCPKHKSKYQPDGTFISGKATRGMDRYAIRRDGNTIVVDTGTLHRQDADPNGWKNALARIADGEK